MSEAHVISPAPAGVSGLVDHHVGHHYSSALQEYQSCKFGFWLFLATEILLFGGLFAAYFIYNGLYPETFHAGSQVLDWKLGSLNTIVLLTSSWTMAMGVRAAQLSNKQQQLVYMGITVLFGFAFLGIKYVEYASKIEHGTLPTYWFNPHGEYYTNLLGNVPFPNIYFSLYFTMTGIHGLHVIIGMLAILWAMWGSAKGKYHAGYYLPVELVGLYWHLVDLIWIFLFPLLYLVE
jgi:cytochrome c oxidase subunit 3